MNNYDAAMELGIPPWDEAQPGQQCFAPCWPVDHNGDSADCPAQHVLVGVMGQDGLVRGEEYPAFDPNAWMYVCPLHDGTDEFPGNIGTEIPPLGFLVT